LLRVDCVFVPEKVQESEYMTKVSIRLDLTDNLAEQFLSLKKKRGLKNNSEVARQLIAEAAQKELDS
jgi:metal-responsive CopG/Arc/MetJ family transcriptional regulator